MCEWVQEREQTPKTRKAKVKIESRGGGGGRGAWRKNEQRRSAKESTLIWSIGTNGALEQMNSGYAASSNARELECVPPDSSSGTLRMLT
jgi:hypothetical protein